MTTGLSTKAHKFGFPVATAALLVWSCCVMLCSRILSPSARLLTSLTAWLCRSWAYSSCVMSFAEASAPSRTVSSSASPHMLTTVRNWHTPMGMCESSVASQLTPSAPNPMDRPPSRAKKRACA